MKANLIVGKKQIILASLVMILGVAVYLNWSFANTNDQLEATNKVNGVEAGAPIDNTGDGVVLDETGLPLQEMNAKDEASSDKTENKPNNNSNNNAANDNSANKNEKKTNAEAALDATQKTSANNTEPAEAKGKNLGDAQLVNAKTIADETYFVKAKLSRAKSRDASIQTISTILDDEKLTEADKKDASQRAMAITDAIEAESKIENLIKAKGFEECMVYISEKNASVVVKTSGLDQNQATQIKNIVVTEGKISGENVSITEVQ